METKFSESKISNKDTDTVNTENCSYCNKPFNEELWCKKCINSLEKLAENGDKEAMFNLAKCYKNGEETEKNLEKSFYWYQKAAENGDTDAMFNLAIFYKDGEETEKDLEKVFHWYQKAAKKNLEKAFYWYQKAAENGDTDAMFNLAICYRNGEGTEKNLEKAFYWYQKAAENAMFKLAICYKDGEGTEMNLEKTFYWFQKAAENGCTDAMFKLAICYKDGEGTEMNLEKAFYWYQQTTEVNKASFKNEEVCNECKQPYIDYQWCQQCNTRRLQQDFSNWTSKNEFIDEFIQEAQLNARNSYEILEWIPYNRLSNINYYDKGGFSEIHKAIWSDGPIYSWNFDKQKWKRCNFQTGYEVVLKILKNSSNLDSKFLDEWKYHYNCQKKSFSRFIQFFGITQDPNNLDYIIVMSYARKGSLRKCLSDIIKLKWQDRLQLLKKIILGLKVIHESNLTHGLCKPVSDLQDSDNGVNEIYGVIPYMAPEILRNKPYTLASDIYSLSMIMWEFTLCKPPFNHEAHDHYLGLSICEGKRPEIIISTPKCYIDLMKKCWDSNPSNRPTIIMLENIISEWIRCIDEYYRINSNKNDDDYYYKVTNVDNQLENDMLEFILANEALGQEQENTFIISTHPQAYYTSRKLTEMLALVQEKKCLYYV
ncbi:kinase-like domain-containing protein [Rhizophagus irregularis DAOM 181602=DAOM 197198]|nr:kinase-like domain-containing protein [Rhizophagus irregularis DAOM 181602=DAOM 197198]